MKLSSEFPDEQILDGNKRKWLKLDSKIETKKVRSHEGYTFILVY